MTNLTARLKKRPVPLPEPVARVIALPRRAPALLDRDEVRLFAITFMGGFLFTTLFIA